MFDLIRIFEKKEYVTDFLNGNFYMNSIGHFWGLSSAVQNDIAEGIGESMDTESFMNKYGVNYTQVFDGHLLLPIMNRIEAMKYVHVCCLSLHEYDDNAKIVSTIPSEMPDYNRARKLAADDENRIYDEHTIFKIGEINDIAEEIDIDLLFNNIGKLYSANGTAYKVVDEMPILWKKRKVKIEKMMNDGIPFFYDAYPNQYVGWSPRESFRNKIMELDNGKFKPVLIIG